MSMRIEQDRRRFREIVRGHVRENLKEHLTHGEMIGRRGKEYVSIPLPQIELPRFRFGEQQSGGVGAGNGENGQPTDGDGQGQAGNQPGRHIPEVELSIEELTEIMGEALALPRIEPRGNKQIVSRKAKYNSIHNTGPESLHHYRRTYREALKREIGAGTYNPRRPVITPIRADKRYRVWKEVPQPQSQALILYIMDVSGSMGDEQKEIVRIESYWIDAWIKRHYEGVTRRFVIHDAQAQEVDEQTFFTTRESGGTLISSSYSLAQRIVEQEYDPAEWNLYIFQFSDGDNWAGEDTAKCLRMLDEFFLPRLNLFGYGQVKSPYGSGQYITVLRERMQERENLILSQIENKAGIMDSIREFLGTGK